MDHYYDGMHVIQPYVSDFDIGDNYLRIYNLGEPDITNTYDIVMYQDSKSVDYKVVKASDNSINVELLTND